MFYQLVLTIFFVIGSSFSANTTIKRGIFENNYGNDFHVDGGFGGGALIPGPLVYPQDAWLQKVHGPSPADIASAIQAAKEASAAVMAAQHRVQEAKAAVLNQQHIATHKQTQAALALQKAEAAAAVQQQEAKSAATALVQAQQRLAHAKSEVANLQRIASGKEAHAAAVIQKSAAAAAVEIQKTDDAARKLSALQHSNTATIKQVAASKEGSLSATSAAVAASDHADSHPVQFVHLQPWG